MDMIVNDLSFAGQFREVGTFHESIIRLMKMRDVASRFGCAVYCHRNLLNAEVMPNVVMPQALQSLSQPQRSALMQWLTRHGPFWEDERNHDENDYLELDDGTIVTDSACR